MKDTPEKVASQALQVCNSHPEATHRVNLRKHSCRSVWCPVCFKNMKKRGAAAITERLLTMDWRRVRVVMLSVDRSKFASAEDAFLYIREKKSIAQLVHNLNRTMGKGILDWVWFLEWHKDGFPHWHMVVEVEKEGPQGMISGDALRKYWGHGQVHEGYIKDQKHWNRECGYFEKHGYFEKEDHQGVLPSWAMDADYRIRRTGSKRLPEEKRPKDLDYSPEKKEISQRQRERQKKMEKVLGIENGPAFNTYRVILNKCGSKTQYAVESDGSWGFGGTVNVPYRKLIDAYRNFGEYREGVGFILEFSEVGLSVFMEYLEILHNERGRKNGELSNESQVAAVG